MIDLDEWADMHGYPAPFPVPAGITVSLWRKIERIPFRLAGKVSIEERVLDVVTHTRVCLRRRQAPGASNARSTVELLRFTAALPSTEGDGDRQTLVVHRGPCGSAPLVLTIGLASERWARSAAAASELHADTDIQPVFP